MNTSHTKTSNIYSRILTLLGWKRRLPEKMLCKSVICVAPHTSNYDFPLGLFYYLSLGRRPHFLIKKEWFVFPLNFFFRAFGGFAVNRKKGGSVVSKVVEIIASKDNFNIAITPEGTRSRGEKWKTGFYRIALEAGIPIELAFIDYPNKELGIFEVFIPTGNMEEDIAYIRSRYSAQMAKYPEKFTA